MISKKLLFIFLSIFLLLQSGCWSRVEIEDLAIVSAVGIDRIEIDGTEKWRTTLEIYHPKALAPTGGEGGGSKGGGQATTWVVSSIGDTIQEAANNFSSRSPRILFYGHSYFIVIGKETAERENLADILAFFFGTKEIRLRSRILISDSSAFEMLTAGWELEQDLASEVMGLIEQTSQRLSRAVVLDLKEVGDALVSPGKDVITGRLEVFPTPEHFSRGRESGQDKEQYSVRLHGSAVFSQGKMEGWFDEMETRGYLFIKGEAKMSVMPLKFDKDTVFDASVRLMKNTSKVKVEIHEGQPVVKIKIKTEGQIEELAAKDYKVTPNFLDEIGKKVSQEAKKEVLMAIEKAKVYRADVFGFGQGIHRKYPDYWRQIEAEWRDHFVNLPIQVEVETYIRRTGAFNQPVRSL